jgi:hypothetical protein
MVMRPLDETPRSVSVLDVKVAQLRQRLDQIVEPEPLTLIGASQSDVEPFGRVLCERNLGMFLRDGEKVDRLH